MPALAVVGSVVGRRWLKRRLGCTRRAPPRVVGSVVGRRWLKREALRPRPRHGGRRLRRGPTLVETSLGLLAPQPLGVVGSVVGRRWLKHARRGLRRGRRRSSAPSWADAG